MIEIRGPNFFSVLETTVAGPLLQVRRSKAWYDYNLEVREEQQWANQIRFETAPNKNIDEHDHMKPNVWQWTTFSSLFTLNQQTGLHL
jgi:hypothetical protein